MGRDLGEDLIGTEEDLILRTPQEDLFHRVPSACQNLPMPASDPKCRAGRDCDDLVRDAGDLSTIVVGAPQHYLKGRVIKTSAPVVADLSGRRRLGTVSQEFESCLMLFGRGEDSRPESLREISRLADMIWVVMRNKKAGDGLAF